MYKMLKRNLRIKQNKLNKIRRYSSHLSIFEKKTKQAELHLRSKK